MWEVKDWETEIRDFEMSTTVPHQRTYRLNSFARDEMRREVFGLWLEEEPGTSAIRHIYRYDVERLSDGSSIYLTRPARLNKGADFVIYCENYLKWKNLRDKPPKHIDLFGEIGNLVKQSVAHHQEVLVLLRDIWSCRESVSVLQSRKLFADSIPCERMLLLSKWFFIEQDVTYWTDSGRNMLWDGIVRRFGAPQ